MSIPLLAIDDDSASLALLEATLGDIEDLELIGTSDPQQALQIVRNRAPRIVVTDLVMPGLSGMQLLEEIGRLDPSIEVILLTGHYSPESAVEAIRKGASDYLTKPVSPERLR